MRKVFFIFLIIFCCLEGYSQNLKPAQRSKARMAQLLQQSESVSKVTLIANDSNAFISWTKRLPHNVKIKKVANNLFVMTNVNAETLRELLTLGCVEFIDRADRSPAEETVLGDFDQSLNGTTSVRAHYPLLTGAGLTLSIKEKPFDYNDLDLRGRVILTDQFDEPSTLHATIMATIAAGGGNSNPSAKGAAWGASLTTSDFDELLPDDGDGLIAMNAFVQNHSYGVGLENYYGIESYSYDLLSQSHPQILHVFSSGNEGDKFITDGLYANISGFANLTGQFKVSKNSVAVGTSDQFGNVVARSSRGPAHDGRIKPELIAYGSAGSSEAAAVVSGIAVLIQEAYKNRFGSMPDAALVKAVLINSASDAGRPYPDFETGFGNADALRAIQTIETGRILTGSAQQDEEQTFSIAVPSNVHELKVTLVWNDPPAEPFTDKALVHDLDLVVRHINSGESWQPWVLNAFPSAEALQEVAQRGTDRINNVEQITVSRPPEGLYEIKISGYAVTTGSQSFSIAYEISSGFEWRYPLNNDFLTSASSHVVRWRWNEQPTEGVLEYRLAAENEWYEIAPVNLAQSWFEWLTPDTAARFQLRIKTGELIFESPFFPVSKPDRVKVGYNCDDELMVFWNEVAAADEYILYTLGEKYLEPVMVTPHTLAILNKNVLGSNYLSVAPLFGNNEGARELTIDYNVQGTGCYFISFIPQKYFVDEEAVFDVKLGTAYKLQSATLQRLINGTFVPVQTLSPVTDINFQMTDRKPLPGIGKYRIQLTTTDQNIYSEEEEILFLREHDLYLYPNPIASGESVNIVLKGEEPARIELLDRHGKFIRKIEDDGPVKTIATASIAAGTYLLRVHDHSGKVLIRKLMIY